MNSQWQILIFFAPLVVLLFFMSRSGKKQRAKMEQERHDALQPGTKIVTIGGLVGTVVTVGQDTVTIKGFDGSVNEYLIRAVRGACVENTLSEEAQSETENSTNDVLADVPLELPESLPQSSEETDKTQSAEN